MAAEQRMEIRRTFIEGQGHLVEEVPVGTPTKQGQTVVQATPGEPAVKVALTAADISPELARQVCESTGLVVVPASFLNPEQLAELNIKPDTGAGDPPPMNPGDHTPIVKAGKMPVEQIIGLIQKADSFDKLNALMADETRKTAIAAAEARAEELKAQGAK